MTTTTETATLGLEPTRRPRALYGRLWAAVPRELGFLILTFPIALVGFVVTVGLFSSGFGTLVTFFIGLFLLIAAMYVSRGFGMFELIRLKWAGRPGIPAPDWQDARARTGFWGWLRSILGNGHYWLALLHTMVVNFAVSLISWIITVVWLTVSLSGVSYFAWQGAVSDRPPRAYLSRWLLDELDVHPPVAAYPALEAVLLFLIGLALLSLLPFITRGLVLAHYWVARGLLGAWKSDALRRQVIDLSESRGAASTAEGQSLRRLERDIHDGPQQRLVRMQMDLASADRQLDQDPEKARALIAEAMQQSKDALEELRALSRGFAPPILLDRGLVAALESAAVRGTIPTHVVDELPEHVELPQEIERNAYFVASEALANAAKHSGATEAEVRVGLRRLPESDETWLDVVVTDNGVGGAASVAGHGLAGLDDRMRGIGGTLEVASPAGGPTVISAHLPVTTALGASV
ncbi:MAG: sensor histidine kinase [Glaciihabitans sp.]|nr:sensor histidine kinase [Glaciihabitans sp.]